MVSLISQCLKYLCKFFLRCFCFKPRKFQSIFIKDSPNIIDSMWLFFILFHFACVFSPFEMLFCIVHECFISLHSFSIKVLKCLIFLLLIATMKAFKIFVSVWKFPSQNFTVALLTGFHSWWLLLYIVLCFPFVVVLWHLCIDSKAV